MPVPFKNDAKKLHKFLVSQIQQYMKRETPQDQVSSQESKAGLTFKNSNHSTLTDYKEKKHNYFKG